MSCLLKSAFWMTDCYLLKVQHFEADLYGPVGGGVAAKLHAGLDKYLAVAAERTTSKHPKGDLQAAECRVVFPVMY